MADDMGNDVQFNNQLDAFELYYLIVENAGHASSRDGGPVLPALGHAISGSAATATSKLLLYPLDLVIARLQVQKHLRRPNSKHPEYQSILDAANKIYHHEGGISAFYTGCLADVTKGIADSFLFFLAYSFLQERAKRRASARQQQISVVSEMGIGIIAGSFAKLVTTPLANIITRQQTAALLTAKDAEEDDALKQGDALTVRDIAKQIYKDRGLQGFWAGYSLSVILTLNPAITFAVDKFLHKLNSTTGEVNARLTFLIAAVSKAIATTITYPVTVAKARAQATPHTKLAEAKGTKKTAKTSVASRLSQLLSAQYAVLLSLQRIYKQDGLAGLYSGLEGEVIKGFLSHGLTMMVKDRVHHSIIELYYFLLKLTRQWPAELAKAQAITASVVVDARRRVQNIGETAVDAGKEAVSNASEIVSNVAESGKVAVEDVAQRAENIAVTVVEGAKTGLSNSQEYAQIVAESGKDALGDASQRVENISTTMVEAGKHAIANVPQNASETASSLVEAGQSAAQNAGERASNIGVTLAEGAKFAAGEVSTRADNVSTTLTEVGQNALSGVGNRVENVAVTMVEGGKSVVDKLKGSS